MSGDVLFQEVLFIFTGSYRFQYEEDLRHLAAFVGNIHALCTGSIP